MTIVKRSWWLLLYFVPTLLKEERNVINSSPESCNGKVKPQLSSLSFSKISFSLLLHFVLSILAPSFWLLLPLQTVSKNIYPFNLQFRSFYSCIVNFFIFFVFIFYIVLIMKIHSFLWIRNWRKNYIMKYLHNRNSYSFHHSIATFVFIT